jgi:4-hydroxybenzoate polyprenyltransferase
MQYWSVLFLLALAFPVLCYLLWPSVTRVILSDLRLPRILHYVALAGLGAALWLREEERRGAIFQDTTLWMRFGLLVVCLTYAAIFAIVTNNLEDLEADRISNRGRPLVQGRVDARRYLIAGIACELVALALAFAADARMGAGILAISAGYYVYSCRPLRLKRVPILSKLLIGFNSLCVAVCGYALAGADWRAFPMAWLLFIMLPLSLAANFVDLKDTAGDRVQGVATLPVLLGESLARHLIAAATFTTYLMGAILLGIAWVYPLNLLGAGLHIYFLYRKPYDERWVFLILVGAMFALDILLFW